MMMGASPRSGSEDFSGDFASMSLASGSGATTKNPLFESDPSDDDRRRFSDDQSSPGGIGQSRTDAPETHLRRVRAGGLLTKLPFDPNSMSAPHVRFFRVAADDRELQWGDPSDAAAPTLGSRLVLHEVEAVVRGHATRTFERHAKVDQKRVGPPTECFSLVGLDRTHDLCGGDAEDAALWAGALDALCARARRAHEQERREHGTRGLTSFIGQHTPGIERRSRSTAETPSPTTSARAPATLPGFSKPPTPPSVLRPDSSTKIYSSLDYSTCGSTQVTSTLNKDAANFFIPMESTAPVLNEGHVSLHLGSISDADTENARNLREQRRRDRRAASGSTHLLGGMSRFANRTDGQAPLLVNDGGASTSQGGEASTSSSNAVQETPRPQLTARTYANSGGEDLVEAFSRSRHGRSKELDLLFSMGVDPGARDANGLTLLHIAAQNNQRKTAKLVLKRTDFVTSPPTTDMLNSQTNTGQTALHYAFAYGYHELGRYLLSLGADDTIVNVHGMSCYEGLDPDEPYRETLNTPEMLELVRRKKQERRSETMRPGTNVASNNVNPYDGSDSHIAPSSTRGPRSDSAYSNYSGKSSAYSVSSAGDSPTGSGDPNGMHGIRYGDMTSSRASSSTSWDPRPPAVAHHSVPSAPLPSPPVAQVASAMGQPSGIHPPGSPMYGYNGMPMNPLGGMVGMYAQPQSPYGMNPYGTPGGMPGMYAAPGMPYPMVDPAYAQAMAAQQHAAAMAMGMGSGMPAFGLNGVPPLHQSETHLEPPSPIMRGVKQKKSTLFSNRDSDSSNLDTSSSEDDADARKGNVSASGRKAQEKPNKSGRRRAGVDAAAAALPLKRGGKGLGNADLDGRVALRAAAMRRSGFHSSDSDDLTSASEAERGPKPVRGGSDPFGRQQAATQLPKEKDLPKELPKSKKELPPLKREEPKTETRTDAPSGYASGAARREERRKARADERTVLPPRTVSKVTMVLNACGIEDVAHFEAVKQTLLSGKISDEFPEIITLETLKKLDGVFPSPVDLVAIRTAYITDSSNTDSASRASLCDRFFLELVDVKRASEKARSVFTRETCSQNLKEIIDSFDSSTMAAEQVCASPKLDRLVEIALALGDILRKGEQENKGQGSDSLPIQDAYEHFAPGGWKAGALRSLAATSESTPFSPQTKSGSSPLPSSGNTGNLLRHLAKTVAAKSPDLLELNTELSALTGNDDERNSFIQASSRLAELTTAVEACDRERSLCVSGRERNSDEFAESLVKFLNQAHNGLEKAQKSQTECEKALGACRKKFGPAPVASAPEETLQALASFVHAFGRAAQETAAAKKLRERERAQMKGSA